MLVVGVLARMTTKKIHCSPKAVMCDVSVPPVPVPGIKEWPYPASTRAADQPGRQLLPLPLPDDSMYPRTLRLVPRHRAATNTY